MIPENHKEEIINSGIQFMRSITEAYGSDEGMKLWDAIASNLDPDVKGQIFFTLLVGDYRGEIRLRGMAPLQGQNMNMNKVNVIKQIREICNNGLKEAKDLADAMWAGEDIKLHVMDSSKRSQYIISLRQLGCNV